MVIQTFEHFSLEEIDLNRTKILYVIRDPRSLAYDFSKESDNHINAHSSYIRYYSRWLVVSLNTIYNSLVLFRPFRHLLNSFFLVSRDI